jgi:hypothetical protein
MRVTLDMVVLGLTQNMVKEAASVIGIRLPARTHWVLTEHRRCPLTPSRGVEEMTGASLRTRTS